MAHPIKHRIFTITRLFKISNLWSQIEMKYLAMITAITNRKYYGQLLLGVEKKIHVVFISETLKC